MIPANLIMEELKPNKMIKAYQESFREFGVSPSSLLIPKGRQEIRFESFLPYVKKNSTLLDFGCGFSDFAQFLEKKKFNVKYYGCDLIDAFLKVSKNKYPQYTFFNDLKTILEDEMTFDTILCAGTFNFLYTEKEKDHFVQVKKIILTLFSLCKKNLVVDFQSEFVDFKIANSYHQNVSDLINFITKELSRRFSINYTYLPYEYSVNIIKDDEINKQLNTYKN